MEQSTSIEFPNMADLKDCIQQAIDKSKELGHKVYFDFNGKKIAVSRVSDVTYLYDQYSLSFELGFTEIYDDMDMESPYMKRLIRKYQSKEKKEARHMNIKRICEVILYDLIRKHGIEKTWRFMKLALKKDHLFDPKNIDHENIRSRKWDNKAIISYYEDIYGVDYVYNKIKDL